MHILAYLINLIVDAYIIVIIIQVAVSWLIAFEVINIASEQSKNLTSLLRKITDPVYKPIQKYIPPIGGIDITPLIVILGLSLLRQLIIGALV